MKIHQILLIEDNPGDARLILELFSEIISFNHKVSVAETIQSGLEHLQKNQPDIILLDLNLPDSSGQHTFDAVHNLYGEIPIILVSGLEDEKLSVQLIQLGAQDYIIKANLDTRILERSITYSLERSKLNNRIKEELNSRLKAEEEISKQSAVLNAIINNSHSVIIFMLDNNYKYLGFNNNHRREMKKVYAVDIEVGMNMLDLITIPGLKLKAKANIDRVLKGETIVDTEIKPDLDIYYEFHWNTVKKNDTVIGASCFVIDITERLNTQKALTEAEERFRTVFENTVIGLYRTTPDGQIILANPALIKMLGYHSFDELAKRNLGDSGFETDNLRKSFKENIENEGAIKGLEFVWEKTDGSKIYIRKNARVIKDEYGHIKFYEGTVEDITERKIVELGLQESELRFKQVSENAHEWIWEVDKNGLYTFVSPVIKDIMGYEVEEIVGIKYFYDFFEPENKEEMKAAAFSVFARKESFRDLSNCNIHKDGRKIILATTGIPILDEGKNLIGYRGVDVDITERIHGEELLRESEKKFKDMADLLPQVIFETDENGIITYSNQAATILFGYSKEDIDSKMTVLQMIDPKERYLAAENNTRVLCGKEPTSHKYTALKKDGTNFPVLIFSSPIYNNGKASGLRGSIIDMTEQRKSEEQILLLSHAVENSSVSVIITNLNGDIEYVNEEFCVSTGYSREDIIGKNPRILNSGRHDNKFFEELWNTILSGNRWEGEIMNKKKKGELYWESELISPLINKEGNITHFVGVNKDITERKKMIADLVEAKSKAEESDRLKSAFLANMSHEIRTPMNGILGFADLLKDSKLTGDEQAKYIGIIEKSGARMLNIINDIIDISKIEAGQMKLDMMETNINEQLEYIHAFFKPEVEAKGIKFLIRNSLQAKEAILKTDREKLFAILTNLVKNAIKYSKEGEIEIGCKMVETHGNSHLQFYVKDTGIGIPKDRHEAIFERFIQADIGNKMAHQGAGLGLSITKAYIEMLGGEIWVESEEGIGSTFYFTLPCITELRENGTVKNRIPAIGAGKMVNPKVSGLKILIVEDDETSSELISIYVQKFGNEIIIVQTGKEAVEACHNYPDIDLIFMDIQMPEMNGYEATRRIREFNKDVVIIALTAFALTGDREKSMEAGCTNYLTKPIDKRTLLKKIQKYF